MLKDLPKLVMWIFLRLACGLASLQDLGQTEREAEQDDELCNSFQKATASQLIT